MKKNSTQELSAENAACPPVLQNAEEIAETFNYAVLSAEMSDYLKRKEQQLKNEYMNFTANCGAIFAEAQERLAKNGFGDDNGLFRKWIESMGFSKTTVYRMIDIHKFRLSQIGTDEGRAFFDVLPKTLQSDISAKSAPPELVEQVLNGDITTHAEYIKLKKELEMEREKAEHAEQRLNAKSATISELSEENIRLEREIKELENRPVDVVMQRDETAIAEIDKLKAEIETLKSEAANTASDSLDDCFENTSDEKEFREKFLEFYETLHSNALSAIRECANFIKKDIPEKFKDDAFSRFKMLEELFEDYKNEMEE